MAGFFTRLFGGGRETAAAAPDAAATVDHDGFAITPEPAKAAGGWRIGARIEKDGRTHHLVRADTIQSRDEAVEQSVRKARQVIDEQGDRLFG